MVSMIISLHDMWDYTEYRTAALALGGAVFEERQYYPLLGKIIASQKLFPEASPSQAYELYLNKEMAQHEEMLKTLHKGVTVEEQVAAMSQQSSTCCGGGTVR